MDNLIALLAASAATHSHRTALRVADGDGWRTWAYAEARAEVEALASGLVAAGLAPGDRVGLFSPNRPEWTIADLAIIAAGGLVVPIYATSTSDQVRHILGNSGARWCVVAGASELARVEAVRAELPDLAEVVTMDAAGVRTLADLADPTRAHLDEVAARVAAQGPDDTVTIIYTSGTTGLPKGVMLTHRTYTHQIWAIDVNWAEHFTPDDHSLCFLPLSHALERLWTFYVLAKGCMNTYVTDPRTIAKAMVTAQPTMLVSVPKLFEKVYATAHGKVADSRPKRAILRWALRVGGQLQHAYRKGARPSVWWRAQLKPADALVLKAIRDAVGGPKSLLVSGGAPLREEIEEFFSAAGILLGQGYGLTESGPMVTMYYPRCFKLGTVGFPIPGAEFRLGADGELLVRAPSIMKGYWNDPEATAVVLDADGWLHTGDIGYIDTDGFVVVTDRLKDLIVTSGGKNIAPGPIEAQLASDPLIEYAVILGDNRPCLTLLVQPSLPDVQALADSLRIQVQRVEDLLAHPQIIAELQRRVTEATERLASWEQVREMRVLWGEITQDNGLLTPTLKVKRREVEKRFASLIDDMYAAVAASRG